MTHSTSSKRRYILSSINPEHHDPEVKCHPNSPDPHQDNSDDTKNHDARDTVDESSEPHIKRTSGERGDSHDGESTRPRRTRLKLKDSHRRRSRDRHQRDDNGRESRHERSSRSHRSSRRRHHHRTRSPTPPNPHEPPPLDPEAAFRESLFDAMADDEGASYWEGVYGQPIHVYSNEKVGPAGELEQMTDEEYAAYVRQKMWEKTHAGLLEERARREERRKQKREEERRAQKLQEDMERSLRRGEERRQRRRRAEQWDGYVQAWAAWDGSSETLPWPTDGHSPKNLDEKAVRSFFIHGLDLSSIGEQAFVAKLKEERVRWHPDKMQQRLGGAVDSEVMRHVTAVFQIIDKLWTDMRPKTM